MPADAQTFNFPGMNRFLQLFGAAILGGLVAAAVVLSWAQLTPPALPVSEVIDYTPALPARLVSNGPEELPVPVDLRSAARLATPAVVHITASSGTQRREAVKELFGPRDDSPRSGGEGSGVIYTSNGYLITNYHVVKGAREITVTTTDRRKFPASLVGSEPKSDLAILKIEATDLPFLELADSDAAEPGEWVLAVGSPLGLVSTVTAGIISAKSRNISLFRELDAIESFLQTDAAVNPGNSGGPLVNAKGQLLGINTAIAALNGRFQGYSFAIPINLVRRIADDIIEFGSYQRVYLGVEISTLTPEDINRVRPGRTEGVIIDAIFADGSAAAAGLQINDVIVAIGDLPIRDHPRLTELIGRARVGETLKFLVIRDGKEAEVIVEMK